MRTIYVNNATIDMFVDSMCEVLKTEPHRIKNIMDTQYTDIQTKVIIDIDEKEWSMTMPGLKQSGGRRFILKKDQADKVSEAIDHRENFILLEKHQELYGGKINVYKLFTEIQKMRETCPMIEDAYQNLLTVYALNMDGDENVS